jgi:hypothetical protein
MDEATMFDREELMEIRYRASTLADTEDINPYWQQALYNLSTAADHLDAIIARSEVEREGENSENLD